MKHIQFFFLILVSSIFFACEQTSQPPVVKITHEVRKNNTIAFVAKAETRPVIMFYWWIRCNGEVVGKVAGNSLAEYNGTWTYHDTDSIKIENAKSGDVYSATLEYYDEQHRNYYTSDMVTIQ